MVFYVPEFESVIKIDVTIFGGPGRHYAGNLCLTQEWWISIVFLIQVYIRSELFCKNFGNIQIWQNALTTYSQIIFLVQFIRFAQFEGNR